MAYTTRTDITNLLGGRYTSDNLANADIDAHIVEADAWIDGALGAVFQKFNQTTDTPDTPNRIREISTHYAAYLGRKQLASRSGQAQDLELSQWVLGRAEDMITMILSSPGLTLPPESVASETITYGAGVNSWDLPTSQALVGFGSASPMTHTVGGVKVSPNILPETVRVLSTSTSSDGTTGANLASMPRGAYWDIFWDNPRRAWVFEARHTALYGSGASINLAYEWDYRRVSAPLGRVPSTTIRSHF